MSMTYGYGNITEKSTYGKVGSDFLMKYQIVPLAVYMTTTYTLRTLDI